MALYRQIYLSFWTDTKVVDDFTPEDRYFYLYLLTNPHTNLCGCYEVSIRQMVMESGYNDDTIRRLLGRMEEHGVIRYDKNTKEVLLLNWSKYNWTASPDMLKGAENSAKDVKSIDFRNIILGLIEEKRGNRVCRPSKDGQETSVTVTDTGYSCYSSFSRFWDAYPNKVGKQAAEEAFAKVRVSVETLLNAIEKQKKSSQWQDPKFIPHPANWLNQKRWEDVIGATNEPTKAVLSAVPKGTKREFYWDETGERRCRYVPADEPPKAVVPEGKKLEWYEDESGERRARLVPADN